jgi:serine/threonine-protein kinase
MLAVPSSGPDTISATGQRRKPIERRVGKYYILAELGRGGTATVYLSVARGAGGVSKLVVLKALLPEFAEESSAISNFLDEARLAAQLNHPNVVQTYEVGTEAGDSVIVMEYLEGQSLSRITRYSEATGQRFPDGMHFKVLIELLAGLHYAHELKAYDGTPLDLVHRDISPQNVFVTYDGQVKVLDFGIAKVKTSSTHTATGVLKGKISYMAAEQMSGGGVDRRADIFSVGCMLWAAAAGRKLWKDYSYVQIVRLVLAGEIPSPRRVNPYCPEELERIVMKALAPNPDDRYQTAFELQMALEAFTEKVGLVVKQREIGAFVSQLFAETRAQLQSNIERELATLLATEAIAPESQSFNPEGIPSSSSQVREIALPRTPRLNRATIVSFAFAIGVGASVLTWSLTRPGSMNEPAPSPPSKPSPAQARPQQRPPYAEVETAAAISPTTRTTVEATSPPTGPVLVKFEVTPPHARLTLDGQDLAPGVTEQLLPIGERAHELSATAEGFDGSTLNFQVRRPETLRITLRPRPAFRQRSALPSVPGRKAAPVPATAPQSAPPLLAAPPETPAQPEPAGTRAPACQHPFFVDSEGIRRVRMECL